MAVMYDGGMLLATTLSIPFKHYIEGVEGQLHHWGQGAQTQRTSIVKHLPSSDTLDLSGAQRESDRDCCREVCMLEALKSM